MVTQQNSVEFSKKLDLLAMIEFAKVGADRAQVRKVMGSLDNNLYSKISTLFKSSKSKK